MKTITLEKVIYIAIVLLLILTPIPYGAVETWSVAAWEIWVFAMMILWGFLVAKEGRLKIVVSPLLWPMMALLIVSVIQFFTVSYDAYVTLQTSIKIFALLCFFLLFSSFINTDERRDVVIKVMVALCVVFALVGIGQSYIGKVLWQRGSFGPFVNRNHFAGFLEMGVGLALGMIIGRGIRHEAIAVYISCALTMIAGIALSASRGGLLALVGEILFIVVIAIPWFVSSRTSKRPGRLVLATRTMLALMLGCAAVFVSISLVGSEGLVRNVSQIKSEIADEQAADERYSRRDIWQATGQLIKDHPILGVGLGAYQFAYTRYDMSSGSQRVEHAHNDYLQIMADAGLIGGVIALAFLVLLFKRGFSAASARDRRRRSIVFGALAGCFAIAVHSFVEFNLQVTSNAQLFLALAALATPERSSEERGRMISTEDNRQPPDRAGETLA